MPRRRSGRLDAWLRHPLSNWTCVIGWIVLVAAMIAIASAWGGPTSADANAPDFTTWLIAHGNFGCAYPPASSVVYQTTAPLYPLVSGVIAAIAQIGHGQTFPSSAQLGPHCSTTVAPIYQWSFQTRALEPTLRIGYLGWIVVFAGVIALLRSIGLGRSRLEILALVLIACLPSVYLPLLEYFHPEDLISAGLSLVGVSFVFRDRWLVAGVVFGVAILSQQFALLIFIPLVAVASRGQIVKFIRGAFCSIAAVGVPLMLLTSGRALSSLLVGTGDTGGTSVSYYGMPLHSTMAIALLRLLPLVLSALVAWWARKRFGSWIFAPMTLLSLLSLSLALRLVFEVTLYGYYFMSLAVLLVIVDVIQHRLRIAFVVWTAVVTWATITGGLVDHPSFAGVPVHVWQLVLVAGAICLSGRPLVTRPDLATAREAPLTA